MRVALIDDNELMRGSLGSALESRGIEVAWSPDNGLHIDDLIFAGVAYTAEQIDAAIIDLKLPPTYSDEGIRLARALRTSSPSLGIIILSAYERELKVTFARRALSEIPGTGGVGYLFKDRVTRDSLRDAVFRVASGGTVVDPDFAVEAAEEGRQIFSAAEVEVLDLMAQGYTNSEIANTLHLAVVTVEKRAGAVYRKLQGERAEEPEEPERNRRVVTVLEWLRRQGHLR